MSSCVELLTLVTEIEGLVRRIKFPNLTPVEPSLEEIFGLHAVQNLEEIRIRKLDLPELTPQANNTAESLLIALILRASVYLSSSKFEVNPNQNLVIADGLGSFARKRGQDVRIYTFNIAFYSQTDELTLS